MMGDVSSRRLGSSLWHEEKGAECQQHHRRDDRRVVNNTKGNKGCNWWPGDEDHFVDDGLESKCRSNLAGLG